MSDSQRWRIQGGAMGAKPPPGPVKSIDFRWLSGPKGAEPPPHGKRKNVSPPEQIPKYATEFISILIISLIIHILHVSLLIKQCQK